MSDKRKSNNLFISFGLVSRLSHSIPWLRRKRNISWSLNQNLSRSHFFLAKTNNIGETETVDWDWIVKPKCNSQIQNYKRKIKGMELGLSPNQFSLSSKAWLYWLHILFLRLLNVLLPASENSLNIKNIFSKPWNPGIHFHLYPKFWRRDHKSEESLFREERTPRIVLKNEVKKILEWSFAVSAISFVLLRTWIYFKTGKLDNSGKLTLLGEKFGKSFCIDKILEEKP